MQCALAHGIMQQSVFSAVCVKLRQWNEWFMEEVYVVYSSDGHRREWGRVTEHRGRRKGVKRKKFDAVHAAAEHKMESIARAASCSSARQIMFFEIKLCRTPSNWAKPLWIDCYGCLEKSFENPTLHPMQWLLLAICATDGIEINNEMWKNHYAKRYDTIRAETAGGDAFVQISKWPRRTAAGGGNGTGATALLSTAIFQLLLLFRNALSLQSYWMRRYQNSK